MDASLLLRILGDPDDAQQALRTVGRDVLALGKAKAKVAVDVATTKARAEVRSFKAYLASIRNKDVVVNLEVRGLEALERARARMRGMQKSMKGFSLREWATSFRGILTLSPLVVALASGLGAVASSAVYAATSLLTVVASAASAAAGIGALGVAFGALLIPAIALGVGVVRRFTEESKKAGTAAHALADASSKFGKAFDSAIGRGADAVFRGATSALNSMRPVVSGLRDEFTNFGGAVRSSLGTLGREFASPVWRQFFSQITNAAATAAPILTRAFIGLSQVLRSIASAAMPALLNAFRGLRDTFQGWADATSNTTQLRGVIDGLVTSLGKWLSLLGNVAEMFGRLTAIAAPFGDRMVASLNRSVEAANRFLGTFEGKQAVTSFLTEAEQHLASWGNLLKQTGRILVGFFKAAAPAGKGLVDSLAEGASRLADWVESAKGTAAIQGFLARMRPILDSLASLFAKLVPLATQWTDLLAPLIPPLLDLLGTLVDFLTDVLEALNKLPGPVKAVVAAFLLFKGPIGVLRMLGGLLGTLGRGVAFGGLAKGAATLAASLGRAAPLLLRFGSVAARVATGPLGLLVTAGIAGTKVFDKLSGDTFTRGIQATAAWAVALGKANQGVQSFVSGFTAGATRLQTFRSSMQGASGTAITFANSIGVRVRGALQGTVGAAKGFSTAFGEAFKKNGDALGEFVRSQTTSLNKAGNMMRRVGFLMTGGLTSALKQGKAKAQDAGRDLAFAAVQGARVGQKLRGVGEMVGKLFTTGVGSAKRGAAAAGSAIATAARSSAQNTGRALSGIGRQVGNLFANGVKSASGAAGNAGSAVGKAAEQAMSSVGGTLEAAGRAMVESFASGISSSDAAVNAAKSVAQAVRNVMPGSEPKDPRSPLRNLGKAGAATIANFTQGMRGSDAAGAMRRALDPRKIIDALKAAMSKVGDKAAKLGGLQTDLGATIQRIFAEGQTGFSGGAVKSGDLAGSIVGGLPVEDWLRGLTGEIQSDMSRVLGSLANKAAVAQGPNAGLPPRRGGGDSIHNYGGINVAAPSTGGPADPRIVAANLALEMRRRGKAHR